MVLTRFNVAEAKGKVRPADVHLTLNQTRDEKKEQIVRIYEDKVREGPGGNVIVIFQNLARSRFYDRKRTVSEMLKQEDE